MNVLLTIQIFLYLDTKRRELQEIRNNKSETKKRDSNQGDEVEERPDIKTSKPS